MNGEGAVTGPVGATEWVVDKPVVAAVAANAATSVSGVLRMEPGLAGLATSIARVARQRIRGLDPVPVEGVRVELDGRSVRLALDVVVSGQDQVAAVGQAVQRAVTAAVGAATGLAVAAVSVTVLDVDVVDRSW
jgi:uncharacterized alkaline shock family protein YloU